MLEHRKLTSARAGDRSEDIETGGLVRLLDTPIGLVATPICLDFCQAGVPVGDLWHRLGPDLLLVAAMDTDLGRHERQAKELALLYGATTVLANQHPGADTGQHGLVWTDRHYPVTPGAIARILREGAGKEETLALSRHIARVAHPRHEAAIGRLGQPYYARWLAFRDLLEDRLAVLDSGAAEALNPAHPPTPLCSHGPRRAAHHCRLLAGRPARDHRGLGQYRTPLGRPLRQDATHPLRPSARGLRRRLLP